MEKGINFNSIILAKLAALKELTKQDGDSIYDLGLQVYFCGYEFVDHHLDRVHHISDSIMLLGEMAEEMTEVEFEEAVNCILGHYRKE